MKAILTQGLGFGDEGKGSIVDALTVKNASRLTVKYTGGPQCAHRVETTDGRSHIFAQFGAGTFSGAATLLGPDVLINPLAMANEEAYLQRQGVFNAYNRIFISQNCGIITPYHRAVNMVRELVRAGQKHGSCGHGVGEYRLDEYAGPTPYDNVHVLDIMKGTGHIYKMLQEQHEYKKRQFDTMKEWVSSTICSTKQFEAIEENIAIDPAKLANAYSYWLALITPVGLSEIHTLMHETETVVFEGAQGVLLDQTYGFHPYTTWSDCTFANAERLLRSVDYQGQVERIGVMRTYMTRHGAGPFPTEDPLFTANLKDAHNEPNAWQDHLRCGHLDLALLEYAVNVLGPLDGIALTHVDVLDTRSEWRVCHSYLRQGVDEVYEWKPSKMNAYSIPEQFKQTEALKTVVPIFLPSSVLNSTDMTELVQTALHTPVTITSHGPTSQSKNFHG